MLNPSNEYWIFLFFQSISTVGCYGNGCYYNVKNIFLSILVTFHILWHHFILILFWFSLHQLLIVTILLIGSIPLIYNWFKSNYLDFVILRNFYLQYQLTQLIQNIFFNSFFCFYSTCWLDWFKISFWKYFVIYCINKLDWFKIWKYFSIYGTCWLNQCKISFSKYLLTTVSIDLIDSNYGNILVSTVIVDSIDSK